MDLREYYSYLVIRKIRCNLCRGLFEELDDLKVHLVKKHGILEEIEIKSCGVCKNPFIEIIKGQKRCGRKDCILYEKERLNSE